jgi:hypothetical protein
MLIEGGAYWSRPKTLLEWFMFWVGVVIYLILVPILILVCIFYWKRDSNFMMAYVEALCLNPWVIWTRRRN